MSEYVDNFLESDDPPKLTKKFVEEEVAPRVAKALSDYGLGWYDDGELHSREINALLSYVEGKLK